MSDSRPSRRTFLSAGLVTAVAATSGCLDAFGDEGVLGGGDDGAPTLALELSREEGSLRDQHVVDLSETRIEWDEAAFEAALAGETYTTQHRKPFFDSPEDPVYTRHEGTYYRLGSVVVDEATATRPVLRLSEVGEAGAPDVPDAVAAAALPDADEHAVQVAHMAARARGNQGGVPWGLVQRGGYVYRGQEAVEASRLLASDGPEHVTYRETVYAVSVVRERFHEPVYRATVEPVAETPERMEAILRATFVDARLSREELSRDERDVLTRARTGGYSESHPYSAAYRSVLRALHERAFVDGDVESDALPDDAGRGVVRYDGAYHDYWLRLEGDGRP